MVDRIDRTHNNNTRRPHTSNELKPQKIKISAPADELIVALADARENRRARQVNEWERLGQHAIR